MPAANCFFDEVSEPRIKAPLIIPSAYPSCILFVVSGHVPPFNRRLGGHRSAQWPPSLRVGPARYFLPRIGNWCRIRNANRSIDISIAG